MVNESASSAASSEMTTKSTGPTKVIIRNLPPSMTEQQFLESVSPLPEHNWFLFVPADTTFSRLAYACAYLNFVCYDDVVQFRDSFDGYVFVDPRGNEYTALVEFATFQRIPNRQPKTDTKYKNTYEQDEEYQQFCKQFAERSGEKALSKRNVELCLDELDSREREKKVASTPLTEYLKSGVQLNAARRNEDKRSGKRELKLKPKVEPRNESALAKAGKELHIKKKEPPTTVASARLETAGKRVESVTKKERETKEKVEDSAVKDPRARREPQVVRESKDFREAKERVTKKADEKIVPKKPEPAIARNSETSAEENRKHSTDAIRIRSTRNPVPSGSNKATEGHEEDYRESHSTARSQRVPERPERAERERRRPEQRYYDPRAHARSNAAYEDYRYEEPARASATAPRRTRREEYEYDQAEYDDYYEEYAAPSAQSRAPAGSYSARSARGSDHPRDPPYRGARAAPAGYYAPSQPSRAYSARSSQQQRPYK